QRVVSSPRHGREPLGGFGLLLDLERVVELVEEAAERDAQRQFDDLRLAEMLAQPREEGVRDAAWLVPGGDRVLDDEPVYRVEFRVVLVSEEAVRPRRRHPLDREKRLVMGDAVLTRVELRDRDDRQFE